MDKLLILKEILSKINNIDIYSKINIDEIKDEKDFFSKVPTIDKKTLLKYYGSNVDFKTKNQGRLIRLTSGTTDDYVLFYRDLDEIYKSAERFKKSTGVFLNENDKVIIIGKSTLNYVFGTQFIMSGVDVLLSDVSDLNLSVDLIKKAKINVIRSTLNIALKIAEKLKEESYKSIDKFLLAGSSLSLPVKKKLEELFPGVLIQQQYGSAETAISLYQNKELINTSQYLTFEEDFYYEFENIENKKIGKVGDICEMIISKLNFNNPLIRYRTGDLFRIISFEKGIYQIEMVGRKDDNIKVLGLTIFKEDIEKALINSNVKSNYQIEINEIEKNNEVKPEITLIVEKPKNLKKMESLLYLNKLSEDFSDNLIISEGFNLTNGIEKGLFWNTKTKFDTIDKMKHRQIVDKRVIRNE